MPAAGRRLIATDLIELIDQGDTVHLTNRPADVTIFNFLDIDISISRLTPGQYRFHRYLIFNDGSCTAGASQDETLDDAAALERLVEVLAERDGLGQPVYRRVPRSQSRT